MYRKALKTLLHNPLISGSAIIFIGSIIGNLFHFLFNLLMSRNLSVSDYGILVTLLSLTSLPALAFNSLVPITVNFATSYLANNQLNRLKGLYIKISSLMIFSGGFFVLIFWIFSKQLAKFIHLTGNETLIIPVGFIIFLGFIFLVNMAFLQAQLAFKYISFLTFLGGLLKFLTAIGLIYFGYGVGGILIGLIIGGVCMYALGLIPLKFIFIKRMQKVTVGLKEILTYGTPATIALLCMTSFITLDILLVKHFFTPLEAGLYAGLTLIGKVIFYFSSPIGMVMFPLAVKKYTKKQTHHRLLLASLLLVLIPSLSLTFFYFIAPEFTIRFFLKKEDYLTISSLVGLFGIYMTVYSLLSIIINFYLSIQKTNVYIPVLLGAVLQIILINFFHSSLLQVITISLTITIVLLCVLLLYYIKTLSFGKKLLHK